MPIQPDHTPVTARELDAILHRAFAHHQQGELQQAEALYRSVIAAAPAHAEALHLLGVMLGQMGQYAAGVELITRAINANPLQSVYYCNRGNACKLLKRWPEALADYDQAIRLNPANVDAVFNRGQTHLDVRQLDRALADFDAAIRLKPDHADAFNSRGVVHTELRELDAAIADFGRAISLRPDFAVALNNRGLVLQQCGRFVEALTDYDQLLQLRPDHAEACFNRGVVLQALGRHEEAVASYDHAIRLNPGHADAFGNRGTALQRLGRLDAAMADYEQAILLNPDNALAFNNRGALLESRDELDAALDSYEQAIRCMPDHAEAFNNRGNVLRTLNRLDAALASYDRACALRPDYHHARWNKSLALMSKGDFAEGWALYESRWQSERVATEIGEALQTPRPLWQGQHVERLLLWSEQGVGDQVFFASMYQEARQRVGQLTASVDARLMPLFQRSFAGVDFVSKRQHPAPDAYDAHLPVGSLGRLFRSNAADFAKVPSPYLHADKRRCAALRASLRPQGGLLIGLSWSSTSAKNGAHRSVNPAALVQALMQANPHAALVNLQYGRVEQQLADVEAATGISVLRSAEVDNKDDLDGLAALISACDVVVSIQNTTLHMAGALGVRTIALLIDVPDWRWQLERADSPWYPGVRLLRQRAAGDWNSVLDQLSRLKL